MSLVIPCDTPLIFLAVSDIILFLLDADAFFASLTEFSKFELIFSASDDPPAATSVPTPFDADLVTLPVLSVILSASSSSTNLGEFCAF